MRYTYSLGAFGQSAAHPYDLSMCFPQYLKEAQKIVAEIRGHANTIRSWNPAAAKALDNELINLIAMHRNANACLNVSLTGRGYLYQTETQSLLDKARRLASSPPVQASPAAVAVQRPAVIPSAITKSGGAVTGSDKSVEELLVGKDTESSHQRFTPSTAKKGLKWDDWRKLKARLPADFNEQKYLEKNPDVAAAVKRGQFPSGAWHYVMYGSPNCAYGEKHMGRCDKKTREFKGWRRNRRPGYLSGIFSNWNQYD